MEFIKHGDSINMKTILNEEVSGKNSSSSFSYGILCL